MKLQNATTVNPEICVLTLAVQIQHQIIISPKNINNVDEVDTVQYHVPYKTPKPLKVNADCDSWRLKSYPANKQT